MVGFIFNGRYFWRFMCLSQQDILLLAILHGAPVLTAHSDQESHIHRQPSESQITGRDRAASLLPVLRCDNWCECVELEIKCS